MKKSAVILVNLGTPDAPTARAVRHFLTPFLSDYRVVEAPRLLWWFLLRLIVIPLRAKKVANAYREIWWEEGSPLRVISQRQVLALQAMLDTEYGSSAPLVLSAETYGDSSLASNITALKAKGIEQYIVVPLYPQYSGSTTGAIYDQLADIVRGERNVPDINTVKSFYDQPEYIEALSQSVLAHWEKHGRKQKLLISFHGIPQQYVDKGDPYYDQCMATAEALSLALKLEASDWKVGFQSRFGPKQWLQPYTDEQLKMWVKEGVESVDVISPAFVTDCLETLEELNISYRELFMDAGGVGYSYIPCLNDSPAFIKSLLCLVKQKFL
jgi:protoporphyrin/coproporphyrin ferrochelatase